VAAGGVHKRVIIGECELIRNILVQTTTATATATATSHCHGFPHPFRLSISRPHLPQRRLKPCGRPSLQLLLHQLTDFHLSFASSSPALLPSFACTLLPSQVSRSSLLLIPGLDRTLIDVISPPVQPAASEVSSILEERIGGSSAAADVQETGRVS
jgi:hypothetical protein